MNFSLVLPLNLWIYFPCSDSSKKATEVFWLQINLLPFHKHLQEGCNWEKEERVTSVNPTRSTQMLLWLGISSFIFAFGFAFNLNTYHKFFLIRISFITWKIYPFLWGWILSVHKPTTLGSIEDWRSKLAERICLFSLLL